MLTLDNVSKSYRMADALLPVLSAADMELHGGDFAVVLGPSGSGKSTLLNIIGCLDSPDGGTVTIDGADVSELRDAEAARLRNTKIGFIFQSFHLIPILTAAENVAYPLFIQGVPRGERLRRARELLAKVGLGEFTERRPAKLSGGQCQRVAIARALACSPRLVLADEPTANLDRKTAGEIMELLTRLNQEEGITLFIATHDDMVSECAGRHFFLQDGKILERGGTERETARRETATHA